MIVPEFQRCDESSNQNISNIDAMTILQEQVNVDDSSSDDSRNNDYNYNEQYFSLIPQASNEAFIFNLDAFPTLNNKNIYLFQAHLNGIKNLELDDDLDYSSAAKFSTPSPDIFFFDALDYPLGPRIKF